MAMDWNRLLNDQRYRWIVTNAYPPNNPAELRTEFEKDYDRAVFSTPVRRLQDKAQVFPLEPSDAVRTRLTHSLEVSTVARDMARAVGTWIVEKIKPGIERRYPAQDMETIAATCGLLHDLGNPPFGHFGEAAIQDWFSNGGESVFEGLDGGLARDFLLFEGNAQTLRLVSKGRMRLQRDVGRAPRHLPRAHPSIERDVASGVDGARGYPRPHGYFLGRRPGT